MKTNIVHKEKRQLDHCLDLRPHHENGENKTSRGQDEDQTNPRQGPDQDRHSSETAVFVGDGCLASDL